MVTEYSEANEATSEANEMDDELIIRGETPASIPEPEKKTEPEEDWKAKYEQSEGNIKALQKNLNSMQSKLSALDEGSRKSGLLEEKIEGMEARMADLIEIQLRNSEDLIIEPEPVKSRTPHLDSFKEERAKKKAEEEKASQTLNQNDTDRQILYEMVVEAGVDPNDVDLLNEVVTSLPTFRQAILKFPGWLAKRKEAEIETKRKKNMEEEGLLEVSTGSPSGGVTRLSSEQRKVAREFGLSDEDYAKGLREKVRR